MAGLRGRKGSSLICAANAVVEHRRMISTPRENILPMM